MTGLPAKLLKKLTVNPDELIDGFYHMNRYADGARLIGNGTGDGLTNPPCRIGRELEALAVVELIHSLDKAEVSLLYEVEKLHSPSDIALGNAYDKAKVRFLQLVLGFLVALRHALGKLRLLLDGKQGYPAYLLEVHAYGIVDGGSFRIDEL